jgi:phosphoribosylanthranilate isomerase
VESGEKGMKIPRIQIAGLKNKQEIDICAEAGADGFGFLMMLDYPRGDALELETVKSLSGYVRENVPGGASVLISHSINKKSILNTARHTVIDAFQVHNDSHNEIDEKTLREVKEGLGSIGMIKVLHIPSDGLLSNDLRSQAKMLSHIADCIIFDSKAIENIDGRNYETLGGTGRMNNWDIAKELVQIIAPVPVIYAGGLTPDNVAEAIRYIRPYGVDVNSRTRKNGSFEKDPEKVRAFVKNAKEAFEF